MKLNSNTQPCLSVDMTSQPIVHVQNNSHAQVSQISHRSEALRLFPMFETSHSGRTMSRIELLVSDYILSEGTGRQKVCLPL